MPLTQNHQPRSSLKVGSCDLFRMLVSSEVQQDQREDYLKASRLIQANDHHDENRRAEPMTFRVTRTSFPPATLRCRYVCLARGSPSADIA